jgi:phenylacetate-coenzyme A ligase PaaK-like adenylate-forming protein
MPGSLFKSIDELIKLPPFGHEPESHRQNLFDLFKRLVEFGRDANPDYRRYVGTWPIELDRAKCIEDLPFVPVRAFKKEPPFALIEKSDFYRVISSSATTGQTPSTIALDRDTASRMAKAATRILQDFIGSERRPFLVVDCRETITQGDSLGARATAIRALQPFSTKLETVLDGPEALELNVERLKNFFEESAGGPILIYGFTHLLWTKFVLPLKSLGIRFDFKNAFVLHSGGWKKLQEMAVDKSTFNRGVADAIGCSPENVIDFYGLVENVGVVYPDCSEKFKHVPGFGHVTIRRASDLQPAQVGEIGFIQLCSLLPSSFPGHLIQTEDLGVLAGLDGCRCGRRGPYFEFKGRAPKSEVRGCANVETKKRVPSHEL